MWIRLTGRSPIKSESGNPAKVYGVSKNISLEKRAQDKLALFRQVFSNAGEAIAITNPAGSILEVNAAFSEMVGKSNAEVQYLRDCETCLTLLLISRIANAGSIKRTLIFDSIGMVSREFHIGSLPVWATGHLVRNDRGETVGRAIFFRDMTEKNEQERTLKRLANIDSLTGLVNH